MRGELKVKDVLTESLPDAAKARNCGEGGQGRRPVKTTSCRRFDFSGQKRFYGTACVV